MSIEHFTAPGGGLTGAQIERVEREYFAGSYGIRTIATLMRVSARHVQWAVDEILRRRKKELDARP
jgi:hypothetical protein